MVEEWWEDGDTKLGVGRMKKYIDIDYPVIMYLLTHFS